MDVASGTAIPIVLEGDASLAGFGTLVHGACLVGEAGPDFVGEAGLIGRSDGTFLQADKVEHGTVSGPGQRWMVSCKVSLSRAVF